MPKILLVDDNVINLKLHRDILRLQGYHTIEAQDGNNALELAKIEKPNLILMDLLLPGLNGIEVTKRIKEDSSIRHIPIIALTAMAMMKHREEFFNAGGNGYIAKPFTFRELINEINRALVTNEVDEIINIDTSPPEKSEY